jgi:photosystem II stability/assembly factor-like uncharacterized protein
MKKNIEFIISLLIILAQPCHTADSNLIWTKLAPLDSANQPYYDLHFFDRDFGFITGLGYYGIGFEQIIGLTKDGGTTWDTTFVKYGGGRVLAFLDKQKGFTGSANIFQTQDSGKTWQMIFITNGHFLTEMEFADERVGWTTAGGPPAIIKTEDGGTTWEFQEHGLAGDSPILGLSVIDSITAFAATAYDFIHTANGQTWEKMVIPEELIRGSFWSLKFINAKTGWIAGSYRMILHTKNGGTTWEDQSIDNLHSDYISCFDALDSLSAVCGTRDGVIFRTDDGGKNWVEQYPGEINMILNSAQMIDKNVVYIVGHKGTILKTTNGGVSYIQEERNSKIPKNYELNQNYPNPFNSNTTIKFTLPVTSQVLLELYDLSGKKVQTLLDELKSTGSYKVSISLNNLASGLYIYRLKAGLFERSRKMLLLR